MKLLKSVFLFFFKRHRWKTLGFFLVLLLLYIFCLPRPLFDAPTSMVLEDREGGLLGASIAKDGQWRFPYSEDIPEKFKAAIIEFEDRRFMKHWGVDPKGIARAVEQNIRNQRVVSGGSTITMQVIRLARGDKKRNVFNKLIEAIMATRLEWGYSKDEILALYATNAPFGGNVVGLESASWRYYGKQPELLSWGEAATMAVLPNSPSLIHPGRNRKALIEKRNRLLDRLMERGIIDATTAELAKEEGLPDKPKPLPRLAPHLLESVKPSFANKNRRSRFTSTLDPFLQERSNSVLKRHKPRLDGNGIHNACIMIQDVETGAVLAYVGNMPGTAKEHAPDVDIIRAPRSTGSILKPFLYASMLHEGSLLPSELISDIPTTMGRYRPENYYDTYDGVVPADRALIRSLNIPAVRMLQRYSTPKFHGKLKKMGISTLNKPPAHYGLTLIVGGAEGNLFDITNAYASMARVLNRYYQNDGKYSPDDWHEPVLQLSEVEKPRKGKSETGLLSAAAIHQTFETIRYVERPTDEGEWETFEPEERIAWKTGTSFGFRDAWAVGVTPRYAVGVWVGNADGEGRPGLVGAYAAAPILFDLFELLPASGWFDVPEDERSELAICPKSQMLAGPDCVVKDTIRVPASCDRGKVCPYHRKIFLDEQGKRVQPLCHPPLQSREKSWFVLPPLEEYFYTSKNPSYKKLPPWREGCFPEGNGADGNPLQLIYPKEGMKIYVPKEYGGQKGRTVFKATHRNPAQEIHWHLDDQYLGTTQHFHELETNPAKGKHVLTLVDEGGRNISVSFEILEK